MKPETNTKAYPRKINERGYLRKNYDYGEGPYFGTPGGGEKSMGDWIKKKRKKKKAEEVIFILKLASIYLELSNV